MNKLLAIAENFALKMDQDDFDSAKEFLSVSCEYVSGENIFKGPEEIMSSYKNHSDFAKTTFESVIYKSKVCALDDRSFEATYFDILIKDGKTHTYSCKQIINFGEDNKIISIRHVDISGEFERLKQFYNEVGLE